MHRHSKADHEIQQNINHDIYVQQGTQNLRQGDENKVQQNGIVPQQYDINMISEDDYDIQGEISADVRKKFQDEIDGNERKDVGWSEENIRIDGEQDCDWE